MPTCYRHPGREAHIRCQRCDRVICPDCMRPASVGFQCPECVTAGAKTTRQGRTAYGGLRPTDAARTSMVLIGINVVVWLAILATGGNGSRLLDYLVLRPKGLCQVPGGFQDATGLSCQLGGALYPGVSDGAYWQLVTSEFAHVNLLHIGFNMLALWVLGPQLELVIGRSRFLGLYLLSGLAGSALVYWASPDYQATLGASGAIFGLLGALLLITIKVRGDVRGILVWVGINFVFTFYAGQNISWQGHVGGFIAGMALGGVIAYAPRGSRRTAVQVAGMTAVGLLTVVAIVARSVVLA